MNCDSELRRRGRAGLLVSPPLPFAKFEEFLAAQTARAEAEAVVSEVWQVA